ncbi:MAG: lysophospholipid acyltransferase family protein [Sandaracinaceae bacterium]
MSRPRSLLRRALRISLGEPLRQRVERIEREAGGGYDCFGAHVEGTELGLAATRFLYEVYFRVESRGIEHVPSEGAAVIAANHGGMLPFDAAMLHTDIVRRTEPVRRPRTVADQFVPKLPFFSTLVARSGVISGSRRNVEHVLETGQLLLVFPEGTVGIGKPPSQRYRLQTWRGGHAELAMRFRVPVIPVAIVGPDDQWPQIARLDKVHLFGAPYLPIPATPIPLPVRYHIRYGEPLMLHERVGTDVRDPDAINEAAALVKSRVQAMIDETVRERPGIFG